MKAWRVLTKSFHSNWVFVHSGVVRCADGESVGMVTESQNENSFFNLKKFEKVPEMSNDAHGFSSVPPGV